MAGGLVDYAKEDPDGWAVSDGAVEYSRAALNQRVNRTIHLLWDRGVSPGSAVAVMATNCTDYLVIALAAALGGISLVPVNWHFTVEEATYVMGHAQAKGLFVDTVNAGGNKPYYVDRYNANNDQTLLRAQAEEMVSKNYDLMLAVATGPTHVLYSVATKRQSKTPLLFVAADDPVGMGIVQSMEQSGNQVTGVTDDYAYEQQVAALLSLKPNTKQVLLVYDPAHGTKLEEYKKQFAQVFARNGITLKSVPVYASHEIAQKIPTQLSGIDVVLVLKDNTVVAGIDSLVTLCKRRGITLYASDLNSGDKGAALSFGVTEYDCGVPAGKQVLAILQEGKKPTEIPVVVVSGYRLKINSKTADAQGLRVTPEIIARVQQQGGIIV